MCWISVPNVMAIHPVVVEIFPSGPKWTLLYSHVTSVANKNTVIPLTLMGLKHHIKVCCYCITPCTIHSTTEGRQKLQWPEDIWSYLAFWSFDWRFFGATDDNNDIRQETGPAEHDFNLIPCQFLWKSQSPNDSVQWSKKKQGKYQGTCDYLEELI